MKKNISINISGIIFHIEEDGYETLKKYLDSINKYFSTFEDSSEILADIESRIAEIFLSKLNEEKQVITVEDVSALVSTMGSVSDFKAAEAQDGDASETASTSSGSASENTSSQTKEPPSTFTPSKQLMRDQKRKIMGGVCAGLGNYFTIDPLWIRLLFALLFFAYGVTLFIYIVMWIVVPGSFDLDEPVTGKKMFRDPERKILGGVSGGVAAYLGIDLIAVRVMFIVFTIVGGLGLFIYIVLWIILPEARSLTDRVQMQGEPVTLSNIESTIKKSHTDKDVAEESTLSKILLFPFRLLGMLITLLGKILVPILEILRVAVGILIVMFGLFLVFGVVVSSGVLFGLFSAATFSLPWLNEFTEASIPVDAFLRAFPGWTMFAGFIASIVPSIFIILLGVSIVAKRIVFNATAAWTLFVLFFVSAALLAVGIPKIVFSFKEDGEYRIENVYQVNGKTAVLKMREVGMDDYDHTRLTLKGYGEKDFKLIQNFSARGNTRAKAIENANMVEYHYDVKDSVFTFDSNFKFKPDATFRAQGLDMTLYLPYNFPFRMDSGIARFITQWVDCCGMEGTNNIDRYTFRMTEGGLECLDCPKSPDADDDDDEGFNGTNSLRDFDEIEVSGKFDLNISRGDDYSVELVGPQSEKEKYSIYRSGRTLVIDYVGSKTFRFDTKSFKDLDVEEMRINITMPAGMEKLEATGYGSIRFDDLHGNELYISCTGPIDVRGELEVERLSLELTGKSEVELSGRATNLDAQLDFASKLRAYNLEVYDALVEVTGASSAKVNVSGNLEIDEGVASEVDYRGTPHVVRRD